MLRSFFSRAESKIAIVAILLTCLCGGTAYGFYRHLVGLNDGMERLMQAYMRTRHVAVALSLLQDAETGQRGYLLTGREQYLDPYKRALGQIEASLSSLRDDYRDDALAEGVVLSLDRRTRGKLAELEETIALRRREGLEAARRIVLKDTGKHLMDEIRVISGQLLVAERAAVDRGILQQRAAAQNSMTRWLGVTLAVLLVAGLCLYLAFRDVRRGRRDGVRLNRIANHDALTGLLNRGAVLDRLSSSLTKHPQATGLLYLDLDGFKRINDNLGHDVGDQVLVEVAQCLCTIARPTDAVARLGGDEFVVVLQGCADESALNALSARIEAGICGLRVLGADDYPLGCSIGHAWSKRDGTHAALLLRIADQAMYARKAQSRRRMGERAQLSLVQR